MLRFPRGRDESLDAVNLVPPPIGVSLFFPGCTNNKGWRLVVRLVMHELAIAQSIVDIVEERATACNATHVKSVQLRIGEASGVVADSLTFSFEMLTGLYSVLAGTQLHIDVAPHRARCRSCAREFHIENFVAQCPICQEWSDEIISGVELQIVEMEIETV